MCQGMLADSEQLQDNSMRKVIDEPWQQQHQQPLLVNKESESRKHWRLWTNTYVKETYRRTSTAWGWGGGYNTCRCYSWASTRGRSCWCRCRRNSCHGEVIKLLLLGTTTIRWNTLDHTVLWRRYTCQYWYIFGGLFPGQRLRQFSIFVRVPAAATWKDVPQKHRVLKGFVSLLST